ncbi:calcium-binding protein [Streptomyces sp. NPDC091371]|uniref:calcium-binding protein n=1 Tax=Streptomyces sp. NPDC091371 TaxID=3155303 RepID=UPI00341B53AB
MGLALALLCPGPAPAAPAAPGDPGSGGRAAGSFSHTSEDAFGVALQADGKIVSVGHTSGASGDFALARYNTDGSLDATFGTGGKVITDLGGYDAARAVALQADGKIIAAGDSQVDGVDFALARYNTDGSLDDGGPLDSTPGDTFGTNGKVITDFGGGNFDTAHAVAVHSDGKIIAAGRTTSGGGDFAVARYNTDGSPDATFDTDGRVSTDAGSNNPDQAHGVAVQADGKIIAAGAGGNDSDFVVMRYNTDGSLDTDFGTDGTGKLSTDFGSSEFASGDQASGVALQNDGKIVAAGFVNSNDTSFGTRFALTRYNTNGSLDTDFGIEGRVTTDFTDGFDGAQAVAVQDDDKIVAVGTALHQRFAVARYNTDGTPDAIFGTDGKVTTDLGGFSGGVIARGVVVQADDKIVAAGTNGADFALARYNTNGGLDTDFDTDGTVTTDFGIDVDLAVTKAGPDTVSLGDTASYTLTVTNRGTTTATGVTVSDTLTGPGQLLAGRRPSPGIRCTFGPDTVTCSVATLAPGATATVNLLAEPSATGTLTNTATVSVSGDHGLEPSDNTATATTTVDNAHGCTITGTNNPDDITGTNARDVICALGGNDTINARSGSDTVYAGSGSDAVDGGPGADTLIGGTGSDILNGRSGNDTLDTVDSISGNDEAHGGPGPDTCTTDPGDITTSCS